MKKMSTRLMVLFVAFWAFGLTSVSAQTPVFNIMGMNICSGDTVEVDIQVQDFTDLVSFQFTVGWDKTKMQIKEVTFVNSALESNFLFGEISDTLDILTASWFDNTVTGVNLDDEEKILTLKFATTEGDNQLLSMIEFSDNPTMREISALANGNLEVVDGIWNDNMVMIDEPKFVEAMVSDDIDMASNGAVDLTITGGEAPYDYNWETGQMTEDITGLTAGDYSGTVTDSKGCSLAVGPFTVGSVVAVDEIQGLEAVELTPNPASNTVNLRVELATTTALDIAIYNILGERVRFDQLESAQFSIDFNVSDLANGTYFVQLQSKDGIHTEKLLLQK